MYIHLIVWKQMFNSKSNYSATPYTPPAFLTEPSGIRVGWGIEHWQIRGRKASNFSWATFGWASCNLCLLCIALDLAVLFKL